MYLSARYVYNPEHNTDVHSTVGHDISRYMQQSSSSCPVIMAAWPINTLPPASIPNPFTSLLFIGLQQEFIDVRRVFPRT